MPNWYKEKRSRFERNIVYNFLIHAGVSSSNAQRMRDWSIGHIVKYLSSRGDENENSDRLKRAGSIEIQSSRDS